MVADCVEVEVHHVEGFDRRLIVEEGGDQGTGTDQITGRHENRSWIRRPVFADQRGQVSDATELGRPLRGRRWYRLHLPVEVVQSQYLEIDYPVTSPSTRQ